MFLRAVCHRCLTRTSTRLWMGEHLRFASTAEEPPIEHSLKREILQSIKISGPMTVAEYMKFVLTHPILGFYMKEDVFGSKGHFTTNPEISQIFGELLGAWIVNEWHRNQSTLPFRVIELGPGRGTLADDIARVLRKFTSADKDDVSLHLVEVSDHMKGLQEKKLSDAMSRGLRVHWYRSIDELDLNDGFNVFLAHEFLDALPVHKFQRDPKGQFCEVMVDAKGESDLQFLISNASTPASKFFTRDATEDQMHIEICPDAAIIMDILLDILNADGVNGCILIGDYGYTGSAKVRDTLRAFKNHQLWDALEEPGSADLTADVDFDFIKRIIAERAVVFGPVTQKDFLERLGIAVRLQMLLKNVKDEKDRADLISGVQTLVMSEIGQRFKFMSIYSTKCAKMLENEPPAGFLPLQVTELTSRK